MDRAIIERELAFRTSRSGGKGGQHVNKVETRVELLFAFPASAGLSAAEKALAVSRLANYLDSEQRLHLFSDRFRTQLANKRAVTVRFFALLEPALVPPKIRKPTKVSRAAKAKRLAAKRKRSEKKTDRRKDWGRGD